MSRFRQSNLGTIDKIDVTPLVDLTFLLLIVFMITAPILEYSVTVNPPELNAARIETEDHLIVTLDAGGALYLGDAAIDRATLGQRLTSALAANAQLQVFIRADEARPYGEVVDVLRVVKQAGVQNFSLVTTAEEP